ncbi:hypothetical protein [Idiomarina sp. HP20-50]|uniref:hypothetical protein n=1 Tax=Idiomarina sp. HP20-50 TaxID=3070813 RepID=UPI00294B1BB9|nr:hypothetical protein [Idiomarina sp. HP20-50]MDV6315321.1 hypothetical protein [Idiomarina sp. HP20-50]
MREWWVSMTSEHYQIVIAGAGPLALAQENALHPNKLKTVVCVSPLTTRAKNV